MISRAVYRVILLLYVVKGEEPHCSKFDFEEKVLEKMVRIEFEMERIKLEMQKTVEAVQKMNTQVESNVDLLNKKQEIDNQMGQLELLKDKLSEEVKSNLASFNEVHRKPTVAFKARSIANISVVQHGQTIVFPVIIMNVGNGYDSTSGIFTAPLNGTYLFTTAFCVKYQNYLMFAIMVDGKHQSETTYYGDECCHSADSNAVLTAGQKVWVQVLPDCYTGDVIAHSDGHKWNTFSGTLVNG